MGNSNCCGARTNLSAPASAAPALPDSSPGAAAPHPCTPRARKSSAAVELLLQDAASAVQSAAEDELEDVIMAQVENLVDADFQSGRLAPHTEKEKAMISDFLRLQRQPVLTAFRSRFVTATALRRRQDRKRTLRRWQSENPSSSTQQHGPPSTLSQIRRRVTSRLAESPESPRSAGGPFRTPTRAHRPRKELLPPQTV